MTGSEVPALFNAPRPAVGYTEIVVGARWSGFELHRGLKFLDRLLVLTRVLVHDAQPIVRLPVARRHSQPCLQNGFTFRVVLLHIQENSKLKIRFQKRPIAVNGLLERGLGGRKNLLQSQDNSQFREGPRVARVRLNGLFKLSPNRCKTGLFYTIKRGQRSPGWTENA